MIKNYGENMPNANFKRTQKYNCIKQIWTLYKDGFYEELRDAIVSVANSYSGGRVIKKRLRDDLLQYFKNIGEL